MQTSTILSCICIGILLGISIAIVRNKQELFSWAPYTPRVKGVTIPNRNIVMLQSALDSGMLTPQTLDEIMPSFGKEVGEKAYEEEVKTIYNSLEMQQTLEDERMKVAAATASYIPEKGLPPHGLWNQRNTLDNLSQPGLQGSDGKPQCACK
jgi:hypothetical protein